MSILFDIEIKVVPMAYKEAWGWERGYLVPLLWSSAYELSTTKHTIVLKF